MQSGLPKKRYILPVSGFKPEEVVYSVGSRSGIRPWQQDATTVWYSPTKETSPFTMRRESHRHPNL